MHGSGKLDRKLYLLVIRDCATLELRHVVSSPLVSPQSEITVDDHAHRESRPDRQRWLSVEVPLHDFLPSLIHPFAGPAAKRLNDIAVVAGCRAGSQFAANAEQRGEKCCPEQSAPMIVDFVFQPGISGGVGAGLALQHN